MDSVTVGKDSYQVTLNIQDTNGQGLAGFLFGGSTPHLGCSVVAVPSKRLYDEGITCDISQICLPGHKDVYAACAVAKILALKLNQPVCIAAGIHIDGAGKEDIDLLMNNAKACAYSWLKKHEENLT